MTNKNRAKYFRDYFEDHFAAMFENDFIDELYMNCFERRYAREISAYINYNTKHRYNVNFTETNDLSTLSFKTKAAYNYFKKKLVELFGI